MRHRIRNIITNIWRKNKKFEVYEKVTFVAHNGSVRECDIIVKDKTKSKKIILVLTIKFEISSAQPEDINNYEYILIYNPTFQQLHITKQNILLDIVGTILKFYSNFWYQYKFVYKDTT